ncbi:hypothetical protein JCM10207_001256 [Rhodosporidiobolus poonsookiae]
MPGVEVGAPLLPPSFASVLHDCLHHWPPLYFAEFEAIYQAVDNVDELNKAPLAFLRAFHLALTAYGVGRGPNFDNFKGVHDLSAEQLESLTSKLPHLLLTRAELDHLASYNIHLPPPPVDAIPPYLPMRAQSCWACGTLYEAELYMVEHGLSEDEIFTRPGRSFRGNEDEWQCNPVTRERVCGE